VGRGGEIRREFEPQPGEIVALEHWGSSGFANTDLDLQLKKHGIHQLIVMGLTAHTCVEATVRYAAELGYEVTMVKDATADYSDEEMHAALDVNIPNYANAIVTTNEVVDSISSLKTLGISAQFASSTMKGKQLLWPDTLWRRFRPSSYGQTLRSVLHDEE
jgi:ureidoacrylate peracid hydrolase